ncbi:MAG: TRAM domain-containing protein [Candidatus Saccharimonadaceae bacterium]|nr:TRAM domain-containing protein [Candidatus Saccharimonadaceae bacterium]
MSKKTYPVVNVKLEKIVGGGQAIGTLDDGRKIFVWGGLPNETVKVQVTKKKSKLAEGMVTEVIKPSKERVEPHDLDSYLSTSPWQITRFEIEQKYKAELIKEAFDLHNVELPNPIEVYTDDKQYEYRNKIEFSWYWNKNTDQLDLAFFKRGSHNKIPVNETSLARPEINRAANAIRDLLRRKNIGSYSLKTLLIRCNDIGNISAQIYVKNKNVEFSIDDFKFLNIQGLELIYSNPQSPASIITERLKSFGQIKLNDMILGVPFSYPPESFFQINIPVYEQALRDIKKYVDTKKPTIDLYSGVGTIGLTIGGKDTTLVEIDENAYLEMVANIKNLNRKDEVRAILSPSEKVLEYIDSESLIIVDPPRAGMHKDLVGRLLETTPERIIYLSCNPVTQARDISLLSEKYKVAFHRGYNFFPRTPHIENLVILDKHL